MNRQTEPAKKPAINMGNYSNNSRNNNSKTSLEQFFHRIYINKETVKCTVYGKGEIGREPEKEKMKKCQIINHYIVY